MQKFSAVSSCLFALLVACLALPGSASAQAIDHVAVKIGEKTILLPQLKGMAAISSYAPKYLEKVTPDASTGLHLLEYFMVLPDIEAEKAGKSMPHGRVITVATARFREGLNFNKPKFEQFVQEAKPRMLFMIGNKASMGMVNSWMNSPSQKVVIKDERSLGFVVEQDNAIGCAAISTGMLSDGNIPIPVIPIGGVQTSSFVVIRGKLLYLDVRSKYASDADIEWVRQTTKEWLDALGQLNDHKYFY